MKKYIKSISLKCLTLCMALSLVACSNDGKTNKVTSDDQTNTTNQVVNGGDSLGSQEEEKKAEFKTVNLGDLITTDFIEMSIQSASTAQELKPTDLSSAYSYYPDVEDETFFYITGDIKNTGGDAYSVEDMNIQLTFDDKYNYRGYIAADDGGNDFYGDYVKPFGKVKYYMYASIPDELMNSYSKCKILFAFHENCESDYKIDFNEYEYCYEINLTK